MMWGYARVSTSTQNPDSQIQMLLDEGVPRERIVLEQRSGAGKRPELSALVRDRLRTGDTLVVRSLDRLGRNARDLHELLEIFDTEKIHLKVLVGAIDSSGAQGKFLLSCAIAFAQLEREAQQERVREGVARARARGQHLGPPFKLSPVEERTAVAWREKGWTIPQIAKSLHCSVNTVHRVLKRRRGEGV